MAAFKVIVAGLAAVACFDLVVLPWLRAAARRRPLDSRCGVGLIASTAFIRTVILALVAAWGTAALLRTIVDSPGVDDATLHARRRPIAALVSVVTSCPWQVLMSAGAAAIIAIVVFVHRHALNGAARRRMDVLDRGRDRLERARGAGTLEPLPPTDSMSMVLASIMERDAILRTIGPERADERRRVEQEIATLHRRLSHLDADRRIDPAVLERTAFLPRSTGRFARVRRLIAGPGLHDTTAGFGRAIAVVTAAMMVPLAAVLVLQAAVPSLRARLNDIDRKIVDLREAALLARSLAEARDAWEAVPGGRPAEGRLTKAERELAAGLALAYECQLATSDFAEGLAPPGPDTSGRIERTVVRDAILRIAERRAPSPRIRRSWLGTDDAADAARQAVQRVMAAATATSPRSPAGRDFEAALLTTAVERPDAWRRIRNRCEGPASVAARPPVAAILAVERFATAVDDPRFTQCAETFTAIEASRRYGALAALTEPSANAAGWSAARETPVVVRETARYREMLDRITAIATAYDATGSDSAAIEERLADRPPALDVPLDGDIDLQSFTDRVRDLLAERMRGAGAPELDPEAVAGIERQIDGLVQYEDFFPSQLRAESESPRGSLRQRIAVATGAEDEARLAASWRANLDRARDFVRLRGFSRIGGVLIGRRSVTADRIRADVRELAWRVEAGGIRLSAVDGEGRRHDSGILPRDLVELALVYAADGRPTTVTMVTTESVPDLRILLHPVLVDTSLGQDAIELDRLVDVHTGEAAWRQEAQTSVDLQLDLYRYAWARQVLALEPLQVLDGEDGLPLVEAARRIVAEVEDSEFADVLADGKLLTDPARCVLVAKRQYFDPELVQAIAGALPARNLGQFGDKISRRTAAQFSSLAGVPYDEAVAYFAAHPDAFADLDRRIDAYNARVRGLQGGGGLPAVREFPEMSGILSVDTRERIEADQAKLEACMRGTQPLLVRSMVAPPTFVVWSGVREREVREESPLLPRGVSAGGNAAPFDFVLQVAFETPPYFTDGEFPTTRERVVELEQTSDTNPWQFPDIAPLIQAAVESGLTKSERSTVARMGDFAVLQRFFRDGLDGALGPAFPVVRLKKLAEELAEGEPIAFTQTARWNARPGALEDLVAATWLHAPALLAAEEKGAVGNGAGPDDRLRPVIDAVERTIGEQTKRRESFQEAVSDITIGAGMTRAKALASLEAKWKRFDGETAVWEVRFAEVVAAFRLAADTCKESPIAPKVATFLEDAAERMAIRRRLGIQGDDLLMYWSVVSEDGR